MAWVILPSGLKRLTAFTSFLLRHSFQGTSAALQEVHSPWESEEAHTCHEERLGRGEEMLSPPFLALPAFPRHRMHGKTAWSSQTPADKTEEPNWQPKLSSGPWFPSQPPPAIWQAPGETARSCSALPTLLSQEIASIIKWRRFDTLSFGEVVMQQWTEGMSHCFTENEFWFSEFCFPIDL